MATMLIGDQTVAARSGTQLEIIDPATEEPIDTVPDAGAEDVDLAVQEARRAFPEWSRRDAEERASIVRDGLRSIREHADEIADTLVHEQGKPTIEARGELNHFLHGMEFYADLASKIRGSYQDLPSALGPSYGLTTRRPLGVVGAIVPYNYPLTLMGTKLGPALITGNTIVVKPADTTPLATLKVAQYLLEAGVPPGVLNVVTGRGAGAGEALVAHPDVRRIAFTGSTATGRRIIEVAGPLFKRVTLELGGSDPVIVCPDADLDKAAKSVLIGRFWNAGQSCLAIKRAYVFSEIYEEFLDRIVAGAERYEPGPGWTKAEKPKIRIGPLNTKAQRDKVQDQLERSLEQSGKVLLGGTTENDNGFFFPATIVTEAGHDSPLVSEEVFGPVLPVFRVDTIDQAIELANSSPYGLGSSVWTNDVRLINKASREIEAGMTWVNQIHFGYDELPFGGTKQSGIGKEHGAEALDDYTDLKSVVVGGL
ncbi:MAG TPA: aldehyde dehydrogenase family protein [Actinomycetota bacterium]|jgi:succinate-semialdehyde dehydrogenase/glutarate-semialdehyde dehydrogenase|nr:aldehyde dehydrogenase family protein [Actinomycetota bacterium]